MQRKIELPVWLFLVLIFLLFLNTAGHWWSNRRNAEWRNACAAAGISQFRRSLEKREYGLYCRKNQQEAILLETFSVPRDGHARIILQNMDQEKFRFTLYQKNIAQTLQVENPLYTNEYKVVGVSFPKGSLMAVEVPAAPRGSEVSFPVSPEKRDRYEFYLTPLSEQ